MLRRAVLDGMSDSLETLSTRLNIPNHRRGDPGISKLPGINALNVSVHRTRVHERVVIYDGDAVVHALIYVGHVGDLINGVVVVDVGDLDHTDAGIGHVHVLHITRAALIPRDVNFSRPEREPSYRFRSNADADTESCAADEGYEGRRIDRGNCNGSRNPAPAASYESPTAVVEGSKAPRLIFNPGPSPRGDIGPVPIAIRGPVAGDVTRLPDVSVFWIRAPLAVVIEIFVAGHIGGDVLTAASVVFTLVARLRPAIKFVGGRDPRDVVAELIGT